VCARSRVAFGKTIIEYPLLRRQLLKIIVPTEQALSMFLFTANAMDRANAGSKEAESLLRILTPLLKFRACRDNIPVATGAMEVRGGNGYIEEWVHARLIRDAHVGVLWEGTSNINALDIVSRAVGKSHTHRTLEVALRKLLDEATPIPAAFRDRLRLGLDRALAFADRVAAEPALEERCAAGGGFALSHHERDPDGLGSSPAGGRCAPGLICEVHPRTPPHRARSAGARLWRMGAQVGRIRVLGAAGCDRRGHRAFKLGVIPGRAEDANPESKDSPMCDCTSEVWSLR